MPPGPGVFHVARHGVRAARQSLASCVVVARVADGSCDFHGANKWIGRDSARPPQSRPRDDRSATMTSLRVSLPRAVSFASAGAAPLRRASGVRAPARSARRARAAPSPRAMASDRDIEAMEARMKGRNPSPRRDTSTATPPRPATSPWACGRATPRRGTPHPGSRRRGARGAANPA